MKSRGIFRLYSEGQVTSQLWWYKVPVVIWLAIVLTAYSLRKAVLSLMILWKTLPASSLAFSTAPEFWPLLFHSWFERWNWPENEIKNRSKVHFWRLTKTGCKLASGTSSSGSVSSESKISLPISTMSGSSSPNSNFRRDFSISDFARRSELNKPRVLVWGDSSITITFCIQGWTSETLKKSDSCLLNYSFFCGVFLGDRLSGWTGVFFFFCFFIIEGNSFLGLVPFRLEAREGASSVFSFLDANKKVKYVKRRQVTWCTINCILTPRLQDHFTLTKISFNTLL